MDKIVFWISLEFIYENNTKLKGGFTYVFVKSKNENEAMSKTLDKIKSKKLLIKKIEFIYPYSLSETEWDNEQIQSHYESLYNEAMNKSEPVFDNLHSYLK